MVAQNPVDKSWHLISNCLACDGVCAGSHCWVCSLWWLVCRVNVSDASLRVSAADPLFWSSNSQHDDCIQACVCIVQKRGVGGSGVACKCWRSCSFEKYGITLIWSSRCLFDCSFFFLFCHNSSPRKFCGAPLGGNSSYRPPGAFYTNILEIEPQQNQYFGGVKI